MNYKEIRDRVNAAKTALQASLEAPQASPQPRQPSHEEMMERGASMADRARQLAEQTAEEEGVSIDRICVMATQTGEMCATVM